MRTRIVRFMLLALIALAIPPVSHAGIILSIGIAPPPLPVYDQPLCPGDGYIWTPGYWAYDSVEGYFWVPGTWVEAPDAGLLWTPGYWGWGDGVYVFHEGYWGPHVGFYGGIDYGFGYTGVGYAGGYWNNGAFFYNRSVNHIGSVRNVYNKTVVNITVNHVSYNGGNGGVSSRPTAEQQAAARDHHIPPTSNQTSHIRSASGNRQLFESQNHGKPAIAATSKPADFSGHNVVAAKAAAPSYKPATARSVSRTPGTNAGARPNTAVHTNNAEPAHAATPQAVKPAPEQSRQKPQPAVNARQENVRPSQPKSEQQDHQRIVQRKPEEQPKQQVEPRRQPPTEQVQQKHATEQHTPQQHAAEPRPQEKARPASKPEGRPESKPPAPKEKEKK